MGRTGIDFFALPSEIFDWVTEWAHCFHLYIVTIRFFPTDQIGLIEDGESLLERAHILGSINEVCLAVQKPELKGMRRYDLLIANPDWLIISMPRVTDKGIEEANMGSVARNPDVLKVWRTVAKDLKKRTAAGLWFLNPETGDKGYYKEWRYSPGSSQLAAQGLKLFALGGGNLAQVEEPQEHC